MFTTCVLGACGGQERVSNALELQLQTVLIHHVGIQNQTKVLCKSNKWSTELCLQRHLVPFTSE